MKLYLENLKHAYTVKPIFTAQEATELVTLAQTLGPDPSLENRLKSICYLIIEENDQVTYKTKEYGNLKKITIFPKKIEM